MKSESISEIKASSNKERQIYSSRKAIEKLSRDGTQFISDCRDNREWWGKSVGEKKNSCLWVSLSSSGHLGFSLHKPGTQRKTLKNTLQINLCLLLLSGVLGSSFWVSNRGTHSTRHSPKRHMKEKAAQLVQNIARRVTDRVSSCVKVFVCGWEG